MLPLPQRQSTAALPRHSSDHYDVLASTGRNAKDELSKFAGLDDIRKLKFVEELAKKLAQEQAEKLSTTHPRYPKTMRTSMRTDISAQITEETLAGESSGFELTRCAFEQSEIRETTSEISNSRIDQVDGTLTTDTEQSRLSEIEEWLGSIIMGDSSAAFTAQHRSPHELQMDQMAQPLEVSTEASESEASDQVSAMILELMKEQDMCQRSLKLVAGDAITKLETFGSTDFAMSMTYQTINLAASTSQVGSPSDGYSLWESEDQAMALDELGLFS